MTEITYNEFHTLLSAVKNGDLHMVTEGDGWVNPIKVSILLNYEKILDENWIAGLIYRGKIKKSLNYDSCLVLVEYEGGYSISPVEEANAFRKRVNNTFNKLNAWKAEWEKINKMSE